jgi:hypothetical protein
MSSFSKLNPSVASSPLLSGYIFYTLINIYFYYIRVSNKYTEKEYWNEVM